MDITVDRGIDTCLYRPNGHYRGKVYPGGSKCKCVHDNNSKVVGVMDDVEEKTHYGYRWNISSNAGNVNDSWCGGRCLTYERSPYVNTRIPLGGG